MTEFAYPLPAQRDTDHTKMKAVSQTPQIKEDNDVVRLLLERDERALAYVMSRWGRLLHQLATRITGSSEDAEECVNDALLDLWNTVPPTEPPILLSYVCVLVRRRAIDRVRYNAAERRAGLTYYSALEELEECLPDGDGEALLDSLVIRGCMQDFVGRLNKTDRDMFLMRYFRFLSNEEISRVLDIRENTVAARLCRIRKKLREQLIKNGINV